MDDGRRERRTAESPTRFGDFLLDEGDEVILDLDFRNTDYDSVFATSAMEGLHLSRGQFNEIGGDGRLKKTLPFNLDKSSHLQQGGQPADDVELGPAGLCPGADREPRHRGLARMGVQQLDRDGSILQFESDSAGIGQSRTFPPQFGNVNAGSTQDPFRPEVRVLLKSDFEYREHLDSTPLTRFPRHRLNLNRILADDSGRPDRVRACTVIRSAVPQSGAASRLHRHRLAGGHVQHSRDGARQ